MKLAEKIIHMSESKITVDLGGKEYQLNVQNALQALIKYEFDNPDMGNSDDFKDDKERLKRLKKDMKGLDADTIKEQIEMYFDEDEITLKELIASKAINKI